MTFSMRWLVCCSSVILYLHSSLTVDTRSAAPGDQSVLHVVALNVVLLPGGRPQQHGGQAGQYAASRNKMHIFTLFNNKLTQNVVHDATMTEALSILADEAGNTEGPAQTDAAVSTEIEQSLAPAHAEF